MILALFLKVQKMQVSFAATGQEALGDDDIYSYDLIPVILIASGTVKDKASGKNLDNAMAVFSRKRWKH